METTTTKQTANLQKVIFSMIREKLDSKINDNQENYFDDFNQLEEQEVRIYTMFIYVNRDKYQKEVEEIAEITFEDYEEICESLIDSYNESLELYKETIEF